MNDNTQLPGAAVALEVVRMLTNCDVDGDLRIHYRTMRWDGRGFKPIEPEFVTYLDCSDVFFWGTADGEEVTEATLPVLQSVIDDLGRDHDLDIPYLYAARVRKMRPQGAMYKQIPSAIWPLFDACGPARDVGLGNPKEPGQ